MTNATKEIENQRIALPEKARVWVYQSNRILSEKEVEEVERMGEPFIRDWNTHGTKMTAALSVIHNTFLVLAVDEEYTAASGCSIDSSVRFLRSVEDKLKIDLLNRMNVAYRDDQGAIRIETMPAFEESIKAGRVSLKTVVFNNMVDTVGKLNSNWEVPASDSWHARLF